MEVLSSKITNLNTTPVGAEQEHLADIIPIDARNGVERINGIRMNLGHMTLTVLEQLEGYTKERITNAQDDLWIIQSYIERLTPEGPDAA